MQDLPSSKGKSFLLRSKEIRIWLIRVVAASLLVLVGKFLLNQTDLPQKISKILELQAFIRQLDKMISEEQARISLQEDKIRKIPNSNFFEREARLQGMIQPGEKYYEIEETEPRDSFSNAPLIWKNLPAKLIQGLKNMWQQQRGIP